MNKYILIVAFLSAVISNSSCKGKDKEAAVDTNDPKAVLMAYLQETIKGNFNKTQKMVTAESSYILSKMKSQREEEEKSMSADSIKKRKSEGLTGVLYGDAVVEGEEASVVINDTIRGYKLQFWLTKEEGRWKVNLRKLQPVK